MAFNAASSALIPKRCFALLSSSLFGPAQLEAGWAIPCRGIQNNASSAVTDLGFCNSKTGHIACLAQAEPFNQGATAGMATGMPWSMNHYDNDGAENKASFSFPAAPLKLNSTRGAKTMADSHAAYSPMTSKFYPYASSYCAAPESSISEMGRSIMSEVRSSAIKAARPRRGRGPARGVSVVVMDNRGVMKSIADTAQPPVNVTHVDCFDPSVATQSLTEKLQAAKCVSNKGGLKKRAGGPEEDNPFAY